MLITRKVKTEYGRLIQKESPRNLADTNARVGENLNWKRSGEQLEKEKCMKSGLWKGKYIHCFFFSSERNFRGGLF